MTKLSAFAALAVAALAAACASPQPYVPAPAIPDKLQPAANEALAIVAAARGVQIYACRAKADGSGYEWAFVAPEADLFDARGQRIGHHFAGPRWESNDGSRIVGTTRERADAPAAGAIPWLLLDAKPEGAAGAFSAYTRVQRVNTVGGVAPSGGCDASTAGTTARMDYLADYRFFAPR
jgi:hypothetical protein